MGLTQAKIRKKGTISDPEPLIFFQTQTLNFEPTFKPTKKSQLRKFSNWIRPNAKSLALFAQNLKIFLVGTYYLHILFN